MRVLWILCLVYLGVDFDALACSPQCLVAEARKLIGLRESTGQNNRGPELDLLVRSVGGKPGQPWCGWAQRRIHLNCHCAAGGGMASSWFIKSRLVPGGSVGSVFSIWNRYMNRIGHVGIVEEVLPSGKFVVTIEGNTNGLGSREGSGVCRLTRPVKQVYSFARWWK
jgi:hypothetical protein